MAERPLRIAFLHPDLGIGGAERLVVDAALALQQRGHTIDMYTSHHDPQHCFEETRDGTLNVIVFGDWMPTHTFKRLAILWATSRSLYAAAMILAHWGRPAPALKRRVHNGVYDLLIVDQLSTSLPILHLADPARILFYCHFPDLHLAQRGSLIRRLYRAPFDWVEESTTGMSDVIAVNSNFTGSVFASTFTRIHESGVIPVTLYPSINFSRYHDNRGYDDRVLGEGKGAGTSSPSSQGDELAPGDVAIEGIDSSVCLFVSINRFERKKSIGLAIDALQASGLPVHSRGGSSTEGVSSSAGASCESSSRSGSGSRTGAGVPSLPAAAGAGGQRFTSTKLIIAGGWDARVAENVEHHAELVAHAKAAGLSTSEVPDVSGDVVFLRSFTDSQRLSLLRRAQAVVYTPSNEHFGIVPVEAMYGGRPVIACKSGGPCETVVDGLTGYLCVDEKDFARAYRSVYSSTTEQARATAEACRERVVTRFAFTTFSRHLNTLAHAAVDGTDPAAAVAAADAVHKVGEEGKSKAGTATGKGSPGRSRPGGAAGATAGTAARAAAAAGVAAGAGAGEGAGKGRRSLLRAAAASPLLRSTSPRTRLALLLLAFVFAVVLGSRAVCRRILG